MNARTVHKLTGCSLIAGSIAFGLFWGSALVNLEPPRMVSLAVHGLSILLISFGLINVQRHSDVSPILRNLGWIAVAVTVVGLWTVLPLFATGLALVGILSVSSRNLMRGTALTIGSLVFLAAYLFGTHIGEEGAREPSGTLSIIFASALVLIVGGLVATGLHFALGRHDSAGKVSRVAE
jgi:hypothetical protein